MGWRGAVYDNAGNLVWSWTSKAHIPGSSWSLARGYLTRDEAYVPHLWPCHCLHHLTSGNKLPDAQHGTIGIGRTSLSLGCPSVKWSKDCAHLTGCRGLRDIMWVSGQTCSRMP